MGKFVISYKTNGLYYFAFKADNGESILLSEGYTSKMGCLNGIESVKIYSKEDSNFDRNTSTTNKYYFNLKAPNGRVLGESELYTSSIGMERGIESVKRNAPDALVSDLSAKRA